MSVGGTGKTPMAEWLIRRLSPFLQIAVLSRGYSRKSKGYRKVTGAENADQVGDESLLIKRKYPMTSVSVSESRTIGMTSMLSDYPRTQAVILDDAFQHRSIDPGLSILLTEYHNPYFKDYIMPMGRLREWRSSASRADILIVTKCPEELAHEDAHRFISQITDFQQKNIFFAHTHYGVLYSYKNYRHQVSIDQFDAVLIVAGIARPEYLIEHVDERTPKTYEFLFADHHRYTKDDVKNVINAYHRIPEERKCMVTTEKDIVKLIDYRSVIENENINLFAQQVEHKILFNQEQQLTDRVKHFLLNFAS